MKRVTQKDVAYQAKVSQTAVSLAFRSDPSLPKATRRRILAIAEELGYRPDPTLSSLVAYRESNRPVHYRATLAWIQTLADQNRGVDHRSYFEGAIARAEMLGFQIEVFPMNPRGMSGRRLSEILAARNIRGVLVGPVPESYGRLSLAWENLSAVAFGFTLQSPALHLVSNHHYRSMLLMVRKLHSLGYRRIGLAIPGLHDKRIDHGYSAAFMVGQLRVPETSRIPLLVPDQLDREEFVRWHQEFRPDALVTVGYSLVNRWLEEMNVRIPEDLGVAHISPRPEGRQFAAVVENSHLIGQIAVDHLSGLLQRNERGIPEYPQRILIESKWVPGDTVRTLPGADA